MKAYWDSSALIEAALDANVQRRLSNEGGYTRAHSLAEVFSNLTSGKLHLRLQADTATKVIRRLAQSLEYVDLSPDEMLQAFDNARGLGVRGGRVHDYLPAVAAEKTDAEELLSLDKNGFVGLTTKMVVSV